MEESPLLISPMVYLEFAYLYRRKRVGLSPATIYADLNTSFGVTLCALPFPSIAAFAADLEWTSDPFDRVIVAQAQCNGNARLITADNVIRSHYDRAVW
jgi:PIN domain nuclease of toxin-antitoxin system